MKLQEIFTEKSEGLINGRDTSPEWERLKERYKNATMEELVYLIMFMQVFGADIILEQLRQEIEMENEVIKAKNNPERMTMKLKSVSSGTVCINTETGKCEVIDDV